MGLMIHSLGELPIEAKREYYLYLLDYGWEEPLSEVLFKNFPKMADLASKHDAVVMRGTVGHHFTDEVLSWHQVNGQPSEGILPAILITTIHPRYFQMQAKEHRQSSATQMLLIPLRKACKTTSDVVSLIEKVFKDIKDKKGLPDFEVAKELKKGKRGALVDALILQPNFAGIGLDLKAIAKFFKLK
ncbi:MAG: hypothetical protein COT17_03750 [Elusimicrobia bacterium CG08_land_8_20_14_0_20_51_18]|nr:MAG: hypothetical protein COT17_03750 [Elusimicrobia bacterium CG08_land_8_20_14_0_20_51_18]